MGLLTFFGRALIKRYEQYVLLYIQLLNINRIIFAETRMVGFKVSRCRFVKVLFADHTQFRYRGVPPGQTKTKH